MFSVTSHPKSKSYRPFHAFSVHFSLYWISSTHINTICFSKTNIYGPIFLGCFTPHCSVMKNTISGAYPNQIDDRPPWASWSPVMRNPAEKEKGDTLSPWCHGTRPFFKLITVITPSGWWTKRLPLMLLNTFHLGIGHWLMIFQGKHQDIVSNGQSKPSTNDGLIHMDNLDDLPGIF